MFKLSVCSCGEVSLEVDSIPTEADKKAIDELIAPDGFIMAQVFKKLKTLGEYTASVSPVANSAPRPVQTAKPAGRERKVVSEKQAFWLKKNKGLDLKVGDSYIE